MPVRRNSVLKIAKFISPIEIRNYLHGVPDGYTKVDYLDLLKKSDSLYVELVDYYIDWNRVLGQAIGYLLKNHPQKVQDKLFEDIWFDEELLKLLAEAVQVSLLSLERGYSEFDKKDVQKKLDDEGVENYLW